MNIVYCYLLALVNPDFRQYAMKTCIFQYVIYSFIFAVVSFTNLQIYYEQKKDFRS